MNWARVKRRARGGSSVEPGSGRRPQRCRERSCPGRRRSAGLAAGRPPGLRRAWPGSRQARCHRGCRASEERQAGGQCGRKTCSCERADGSGIGVRASSERLQGGCVQPRVSVASSSPAAVSSPLISRAGSWQRPAFVSPRRGVGRQGLPTGRSRAGRVSPRCHSAIGLRQPGARADQVAIG
jgi:hypothetical protein